MTRITTKAVAMLATCCLIIVACGEKDSTSSRDRNISVLAGTSCKKAGQTVSPNGIRHACGTTPMGNIWYVTMRSTGKVKMCNSLGKIRFKSKVVWVCGSSRGSGQWFATKPLPVVASSISTTTEPSSTAPTTPAGEKDAFAAQFTPSTVSPSTTAATPLAQTPAPPGGGFTTTQDAPAEPNANVLTDPKDDPLPEPRVADLTGPAIDAITVSPQDVKPGDRFKVTISASDPAGVSAVSMVFMFGRAQRDFCGQALSLVTGDTKSGTWQAECTAPSVGSNGDYVVVPSARDGVNNFTNVNCCTLSALRGGFTLSGAQDDTEGPSFSNLVLSKKSVVPGDTFTIRVNATDTSGVKYLQYSFVLGVQQIDFCRGSMSVTSGSSRDGVWSATCTVPAVVRNGTYDVKIYAADNANNYTNVNCCTTSDVSDSFVVSNGTDDAAGPAITALSVSPSSGSPGDSVRITAAFSDASGIKRVGFTSSINGAQRDICGQSLRMDSGTATQSTWSWNCQIPVSAQPGRYEFLAYATDIVGNNTNVNCCDLSDIRAYLDVE